MVLVQMSSFPFERQALSASKSETRLQEHIPSADTTTNNCRAVLLDNSSAVQCDNNEQKDENKSMRRMLRLQPPTAEQWCCVTALRGSVTSVKEKTSAAFLCASIIVFGVGQSLLFQGFQFCCSHLFPCICCGRQRAMFTQCNKPNQRKPFPIQCCFCKGRGGNKD